MNDRDSKVTLHPAGRVLQRFQSVIHFGSVGLMAASAVLILLILVGILGLIVWNGAGGISWEFLTEAPQNGLLEGGIFPAIIGTLLLVLLMTVFVLPIGVITAIYLHEYTLESSLSARIVRMAVNNLAGVPSVVFGLFGVGFFVQFIGGGLDRFVGNETLKYGQPALIWAALTLSVLTLPVVIVTTEEALRAVPLELRHASLALGATRFQTLMRIILPQAVPGILTGAILALSRGAGEVAPIMLTGAAYYLPNLPSSLSDQFMHLGYHIYILATQSPDVDQTMPILYSTVLILLLLTLLLNATAMALRHTMRKGRRN